MDVYDCFTKAAKMAIFFKDPQLKGKKLDQKIMEYVDAARKNSPQKNLALFCTRFNSRPSNEEVEVLFEMFECLPKDMTYIGSVTRQQNRYSYVIWDLNDVAVDFGVFTTIDKFKTSVQNTYF